MNWAYSNYRPYQFTSNACRAIDIVCRTIASVIGRGIESKVGIKTAIIPVLVVINSTRICRHPAQVKLIFDFRITQIDRSEQHQRLKLDLDESEAFVKALLNQTQPNQGIKTAASRYKSVS